MIMAFRVDVVVVVYFLLTFFIYTVEREKKREGKGEREG